MAIGPFPGLTSDDIPILLQTTPKKAWLCIAGE
jgi:hypothetical protein